MDASGSGRRRFLKQAAALAGGAAGVGAAAEYPGQADEGESDRDEDDAAPVETGFAAATASFVVALRISILLCHEGRPQFGARETLT